MDLEKSVYTTFEAADICNANITSIKNWIDQGELSAFRTPGGHYRIERPVLDDFLKRHGMPNPFARREKRRILLVHPEVRLLDELQEEFGAKHEYDSTTDAVDALLKIGQWKPDAAVVDYEVQELDVMGLCARLQEHEDFQPVHLIVLHPEEPGLDTALLEAGADFAVATTAGDAEVLEAVRQVLK